MRMFAFEVPFFLLVILLSLVFIAASLRSERELKRRQQNFMSAVTHEFKTPISTLRLLIETALLRPLPAEKLREYLRRMTAEVSRLEQTSDQVLASARLEQSPEPPVLAPHDLSTLVATVVDRMRQGLEARGAEIRIDLAERPLPVSVDEDAFAMALGNLLDNAVKYSPGERKPVGVRVEPSGDLALVQVEDQGAGIPPGEHERIFDRFYRSGDEMTRESSGMGLGLHLVRSAVEAMNGWVRCANREEGPGARFTIVLPQRLGVTSGSPGPGKLEPGSRSA
jgi:two-component system sensor histidine kinase SenX3